MAQQTRLGLMALMMRLYGSFSGKVSAGLEYTTKLLRTSGRVAAFKTSGRITLFKTSGR